MKRCESINREVNIRIDVNAQPFEVYFAEAWKERKYEKVLEDNQVYNEKWIYLAKNKDSEYKNEFYQLSLHLALM